MARTSPLAAILLLHALEALAAPQAGTATVSAAAAPATFTANPDVGPGGSSFKDSAHFRVYNGASASADDALELLEGAYECFVETLGWRSTGLSFNAENDEGPWYKTNVYSVDSLSGNAAGVMHSDPATGLAYLDVVNEYLSTPGVTVHEWGHGLHYHQQTWVDQGNTGVWWETLANWVADTYTTSDLCADARAKHGTTGTADPMNLTKLLGDSYQVIVDGSVGSGNYYQAWPFFTFLTNNPARFAGLGSDTLRQMMLQYEKDSNEDPLHTLARVSTNATVAQIVGSYWAHMAYVDVGHPSGQQLFLDTRDQISFDNVQAQGSGSGSYRVVADRQPRYMGSNIIPLQVTGAEVQVEVTADAEYTGTLVAFNPDTRETRYVTLKQGAGSLAVQSGEEASLVIANTPSKLIVYNGFELSDGVQKGLDYSFTISGATA